MESSPKPPKLVLGLDIGIASCGWALIDAENKKIVDIGVHLWDAPQKEKTKESLAKIRRNKRSARRNIKRSADRLKHCLELFKKYHLVPEDADKTWMQTVKGDPQPLQSRVAALDSLVEDRHLAQALYNICSRRGYIPHGEEASGSDAEGRKVLSALEHNKKAMKENNWRTVGEMMLEQGKAKGKKNESGLSRNKEGDYSRCVRMSQLIEEAKAIFAAQRSLGNNKATQEFEQKYLECLTWEKSTQDRDERVYQTVANCVYFGDKGLKAAPRASLSFEMCCAFERINNLRIVSPDGAEIALDAETKRRCVDTLFSVIPLKGNKDCKVTYARLRKKLDLPAACVFKGVEYSSEDTAEIYVPKVWRLQRKNLSQELLQKMRNDLEFADAINAALAYSSSRESLEYQLGALELEDSERGEILSLPYSSKLFSGYGTRSVEALHLLVDMFQDYEAVHTLSEAEVACGLKNKRMEKPQKGDKLPPYQLYDPTCKNPVVLRVMARVRKLVNAVIREYGMPDTIRIELARELKRSEKEKKAIAKSNSQRQRDNAIVREVLAGYLHCDESEVPPKLVRKKLLWDEQDGRDLYTDEPIDIERMVHDSSYCQIDHILPYSRTCDDSSMNKILVLAKSNQDKKQRSPYEWLEPEGKWPDFKARVCGLITDKKYPTKKANKLLETNLEEKEEKFLDRNLNDTRYATRAALGYIDSYLDFPEDGSEKEEGSEKKHVYATSGGATSTLRSAWGFNAKNRDEDDCHHAVDAAIIAMCTPSMVIKVAKASEKKMLTKKDERAALFKDTEPWPGFADEVQDLYSHLIPTRRVDHGGTAQLYEETKYRFIGFNEKGTKAVIEAKGKTKPTSNYELLKDGSCVLPDGLAFVRLWWDPTAKVRGRKELGQFLIEPVYYADLPADISKGYEPLVVPPQTAKKPRSQWETVPAAAMGDPIVLRPGQAILVNGVLRRFGSVDISGCVWSLLDPRGQLESREATKGFALSSIKRKEDLQIVNEDILGFCYKGLLED